MGVDAEVEGWFWTSFACKLASAAAMGQLTLGVLRTEGFGGTEGIVVIIWVKRTHAVEHVFLLLCRTCSVALFSQLNGERAYRLTRQNRIPVSQNVGQIYVFHTVPERPRLQSP